MSNIELIVGNATTRGDGSLTIVALYRKDANTKQQPITMAVKDSKSGVMSLGLVDIKNSSQNNRPGQWIKTRVEIPEGSFVEFQLMRVKGISSGMSCFVLKSRATGPLFRIGITLPYDQFSTESKGYIEGRFDILSWTKVRDLGIACHSDIESYKPNSGLTDLVTVERLEKETQSEVKVTKAKPAVTGVSTVGNKTVARIRRPRKIGGT